jgi:hypothetical protein
MEMEQADLGCKLAIGGEVGCFARTDGRRTMSPISVEKNLWLV